MFNLGTTNGCLLCLYSSSCRDTVLEGRINLTVKWGQNSGSASPKRNLGVMYFKRRDPVQKALDWMTVNEV